MSAQGKERGEMVSAANFGETGSRLVVRRMTEGSGETRLSDQICAGHSTVPLPPGRSCWACTAEDYEQRWDTAQQQFQEAMTALEEIANACVVTSAMSWSTKDHFGASILESRRILSRWEAP